MREGEGERQGEEASKACVKARKAQIRDAAKGMAPKKVVVSPTRATT